MGKERWLFVTAVLVRPISQLRNGGSAHFTGLSATDRKWPHASPHVRDGGARSTAALSRLSQWQHECFESSWLLFKTNLHTCLLEWYLRSSSIIRDVPAKLSFDHDFPFGNTSSSFLFLPFALDYCKKIQQWWFFVWTSTQQKLHFPDCESVFLISGYIKWMDFACTLCISLYWYQSLIRGFPYSMISSQ